MKRNKYFVFAITLVLTLGLFIIGCNKKDTTTTEETENTETTLSGVWNGTIDGAAVTVVIADYEGVPPPFALGGWLISIPEKNYMDVGTYAIIDDVTATLYSNALRSGIVGTASVVETNTISITLNRNSIAPGTYTLTKQ